METSPTASGKPEGVRKALLIGIMYSGSTDPDLPELPGSRTDIDKLRKLLINQYHYHASDIVVMIDDDGIDEQLKPIKENIQRETRKLVAGAKAGDHFLFHYSGHSSETAQDQRKMTEPDGFDQVLLPADKKKIKDNELHKLLVKNLPEGASLTAIFDSCTSGTLLDLNHYDCNSVWVPWINKGRRSSLTLQNKNIRHHDLLMSCSPTQTFGEAISEEIKKLVVQVQPSPHETSVIIDAQLAPCGKTVGGAMPFGDEIEMDITVEPFDLQIAPDDELSVSLNTNADVGIERLPSAFSLSVVTSGLFVPSIGDVTGQYIVTPSRRTESPAMLYPRSCNGWCRTMSIIDDRGEHPHVVSISASRDGQPTWMDDGESMTLSLVKILKKKPPPTYRELLTLLSHDIHAMTMAMHSQAKGEHRKRHGHTQEEEYNKIEMDNFQEPQLGSIVPLNMDDVFVL